MTEEIYFYEFLSNVDSSILGLQLQYGFTVEELSVYDFNYMKKDIDNIVTINALKDIVSPKLSIVNRKGKMYYIKNYTENVKKHPKYITGIISILRLYKEGNLRHPARIQYAYIGGGKITKAEWVQRTITIIFPRSPYGLNDTEIHEVNKMIKDYNFPLSHYIQLALDNLEQSMIMMKKELAFLLLMIGFESLFNFGRSQITHTVSRHTALLAGKDKAESHKIYNKMKKYYRGRSAIVHADVQKKKIKPIENKDNVYLRELLRTCIKKIYYLNLNKKQLFEYLNEKGFED